MLYCDGWAGYYKTTRLGIGSLDCRGKVCSLIVGFGRCAVMSGAAFYLTTRIGIGSLDFRGKLCSLIVGSVAVLRCAGQFLFNNSSWDWQLWVAVGIESLVL